MLQTLEQSHEVYRHTHEKYPSYFAGFSLATYISEIGTLIKHSNIKTVLDYGCGKAQAWKQYNLRHQWQLQEVGFYDPGVTEFSRRPERTYDLVICTDVMEHVPEHLVRGVLEHIKSLATKVVFFNISTRIAGKVLTDGTNAHATVKPKLWWEEQLTCIDKRLIIAHYS